MAEGRVVGGHFLGASVGTLGSTLVVKSGVKWRKLNPDQVAEWFEVPAEPKDNTISAVGKAVAGAVAPRLFGKAASAAVGAAVDSTIRPSHTVHVEWANGKQSLIKMPDSLFIHLALALQACRRTEPHLGTSLTEAAPAVPAAAPEAPTVTDQAFSLASDLVKNRRGQAGHRGNLNEQLTQLAGLRDQGILTEAEFEAKKTELLKRF